MLERSSFKNILGITLSTPWTICASDITVFLSFSSLAMPKIYNVLFIVVKLKLFDFTFLLEIKAILNCDVINKSLALS